MANAIRRCLWGFVSVQMNVPCLSLSMHDMVRVKAGSTNVGSTDIALAFTKMVLLGQQLGFHFISIRSEQQRKTAGMYRASNAHRCYNS